MPLTLRHTLDDPPLRPLPDQVVDLLLMLDAPPRLAAHLRAVHDVAAQLTDWLTVHYPALAVDRDAVLFGAATHDIGKTVHVAELSGPGSGHEPAGQQLLLDAGIECEDLLVSLDDHLDGIAADADQRLAFQSSYPTTAG